jgi:hypothetical protein
MGRGALLCEVPTPPSCSSLGRQCRALDVTLRVARHDGHLSAADAEATWLLGHTQRISFTNLRPHGRSLYVDAVLHLPCQHFKEESGAACCLVHGHTGTPPSLVPVENLPRREEGGRFWLVTSADLSPMPLSAPSRALPLAPGDNPCEGAPCRTADNTRGSACCRDLQIEVLCRREETHLEALIRSRRSPYLCKVSRESDDSLDAEMISACGYLDDRGRDCTLHGLKRPDGRSAKPELCFEWPEGGDFLHSGCVFRNGTLATHLTGQAAIG